MESTQLPKEAVPRDESIETEALGTTPIWSPTPLPRRFAPMTSERSADVVVVGGGLVGLVTAYTCKRAGLRVVVLESHRVGQAESVRTTAHVTAQLDTRWKDLVAKQGAEAARELWTEATASIEMLESIVRDLRVDCGWRRVPSWSFTETESGRIGLRADADAAATAGIPCRYQEIGVPLPWNVMGALRCDSQAQLEPEPFLTALARAIDGDGSSVFEDTAVLEVHDGAEPYVVTAVGNVRARHVVVATHAPIDHRVKLQTKLAHYRTYVLALRSRVDVPDGLYWDDEEPYHYVRAVGSPLDRIVLVGGEDHRTGQDDDTAKRFEALERWALQRLPGASVRKAWSGQILESVDGLPYIGRGAHDGRVYEATGFGGTGWAYGALAARVLLATIRGETHPLSERLSATRIAPIAGAAWFVRENAGFPWHYLVDRLKAKPTDVESLPPGQGKLFMSRAMKPIAVYRDRDGGFHALSPVCPHLGCIVDFNGAESSWDCPCHGSRFDVEGRVLNGPATRGLDRIDLSRPADPNE